MSVIVYQCSTNLFLDYRRFTVFCLVRVGTDVYETALVSEVDRLTTDISFEDVITLYVHTLAD